MTAGKTEAELGSSRPSGALRDEAAKLLAEGWKRCFVADEPRLSEAVETYRELGYDVFLLPVAPNDGECTECMRQAPDRFRVIYTRRAGA